MSSPNTIISNKAKKQKLVIIPTKQLFIDLTIEDNKTPSPPPQCSSPSAPNAPSKTPSTNGASTSSIPSSSSINNYINNHLSPPPRIPPPPPTMSTPLDITLSLSPITPLDAHFSPPSLNPPPYNPVPWSLLEAHGDTCLCCIHNRTIIFGLRDELQYMFSYIENMFHQPTPLNTTPPTPPTTTTPPPPPSTTTPTPPTSPQSLLPPN